LALPEKQGNFSLQCSRGLDKGTKHTSHLLTLLGMLDKRMCLASGNIYVILVLDIFSYKKKFLHRLSASSLLLARILCNKVH